MAMKLMIVDDHAGMRTMIRQLIVAPGDTVVECASGDEALLALSDFKPDCVTMDISMPGLWRNYEDIVGYHRDARTGEIWLKPILLPE